MKSAHKLPPARSAAAIADRAAVRPSRCSPLGGCNTQMQAFMEISWNDKCAAAGPRWRTWADSSALLAPAQPTCMGPALGSHERCLLCPRRLGPRTCMETAELGTLSGRGKRLT
eukprot:365743-Chlamydomonas_euryale.AAC.27